MSTTTNTLAVRLTLNGAQFQAALRSILSTAKGVGAAIAAVLGTHEIAEQFKKVIELGGHLNDLSVQTGESVKQLTIFGQALADNGNKAEDAGYAINMMQRFISDAAEGTGTASKTLTDLNLSLEDLFKQSPVEQFQTVAEAINKVADANKRVDLARGVFGKSGSSLLPMLLNPDAMKEAAESLGRLPEIMQRNAPVLDAIGDKLGRMPQKMTQLFAGALDILGKDLNKVFSLVDAIDLTEIGQNIGAFVSVVIDAIRDNKMPELIGLLIEAGFEMGTEAAKKLWVATLEFLGGPTFGMLMATLVNGVMSLGVGMAKMLLKLFETPIAAAAGALTWFLDQSREKFQRLGQWLKEIFVEAINFWADKLEQFLNAYIREINTIMAMFGVVDRQLNPVKVGRLTVSKTQVDAAMSYADAMAMSYESTWKLSGALDDTLKQARSLMAIGFGLSGTKGITSAMKELETLINRRKAAREAEAKAAEKENDELLASVPPENLKAMLREQERLAKEKLLELDRQLFAVESDFTKTSAEKWAERKAILERERDVLQQLVDLLRKRAAMAGLTDQERDQILSRADAFDSQLSGKQKELAGLGADPNSISQQMISAWTQMREGFGTLAQQISRSFTDIIGGAINSISSGLTGLIMRTQTWGQFLQNVGTTILTSIVGAIVQMGVRMIATMIMTAIFGKAMAAASTAALVPIAAAQAAIWSGPATLATISSFGGAAVQAPFAIAGAIAATKAASILGEGFVQGGYTGDGGRFEPAGIVHRREFVMPEAAVNRIGLPALEDMRQGGTGGGGSGPMTNDNRTAFAVFNNKAALDQWLKNESGRKIIVDVVREELHVITGRS